MRYTKSTRGWGDIVASVCVMAAALFATHPESGKSSNNKKRPIGSAYFFGVLFFEVLVLETPSGTGGGSKNQSVSVWNRVYFLPFHPWSTVGVTFLRPESRCKRTLLLFPLGSRCMCTQTRCFRFEGQPRLTFFSLEQGIFTILSGTG